MRRDFDEHIEIARRSVLRSLLTLTADAEPLASAMPPES
jgi:hypothetical protein